jgi:hypothetical protein
MLFYRAALPLSRATLTYLSGVIRRHRARIGSCWRKLNCGQQALMVLIHLRKGETFAELAAGFAVSTATAWRYVTEAVGLLAARAPKLRPALRAAGMAGCAFVVLDGTLIPVDRVAADRPFYSGKHRKHGMNLQVIASPAGEIVWVSGALPGAVHDLTAARIWGIMRGGLWEPIYELVVESQLEALKPPPHKFTLHGDLRKGNLVPVLEFDGLGVGEWEGEFLDLFPI